MVNRSRRQMSQATYRVLQEIRENASRLRQIDAGLGYRRHAVQVTRAGREVPLYVGPTIEAVPDGEGWAA